MLNTDKIDIMEVNIIKSESWLKSGLKEQDGILNEAIKTYVGEDERIINIQMIEENSLKRFWIYTQKA